MIFRQLFLSLIIATTTGAVLVGSSLGKAQNSTQFDHTQHMHANGAAVPTMPGQEVFGTIQEIVQILEADPTTDWSKVNIAALREHLIGMDEVTMRAAAIDRALSNGVEITVTGQGRTSMRSNVWCRLTRMSSWRSAGRLEPRICRTV